MDTQTIAEPILATIPKIKVPGIATMSYWTIVLTDRALYFVEMGNALGLGVGTNNVLLVASVIGDIVNTQKTKISESTIDKVLSQANQYLRFTRDQLNQIEFRRRVIRTKVIVPNGKEKTWRQHDKNIYKLWPGQTKQLRVMIERLKST